MKYEDLIGESLEELGQIEKKQKLVQFEKRVRFLILLKSGEAKTQKEAGSKVGCETAAATKDLAVLWGSGFGGSVEKNRQARLWETVECGDKSSESVFTGIWSAEFSGNESSMGKHPLA